MLRKVLFFLSCIIGISTASAEIIDLDNQDANKCQEQLGRAKDQFPIVLIVSEGCEWCEKVEPKYRRLANENPNRAFFIYHQFANGTSEKLTKIDETGRSLPLARIECLKVNNGGVPIILMMSNATDSNEDNTAHEPDVDLEKAASPGTMEYSQLKNFIATPKYNR